MRPFFVVFKNFLLMTKYVYTYNIRQDIEKPNNWFLELYDKSSKRVLMIRVNVVSGRFQLRKSANVNLKVVSDSIVKFLDILRKQ